MKRKFRENRSDSWSGNKSARSIGKNKTSPSIKTDFWSEIWWNTTMKRSKIKNRIRKKWKKQTREYFGFLKFMRFWSIRSVGESKKKKKFHENDWLMVVLVYSALRRLAFFIFRFWTELFDSLIEQNFFYVLRKSRGNQRNHGVNGQRWLVEVEIRILQAEKGLCRKQPWVHDMVMPQISFARHLVPDRWPLCDNHHWCSFSEPVVVKNCNLLVLGTEIFKFFDCLL